MNDMNPGLTPAKLLDQAMERFDNINPSEATSTNVEFAKIELLASISSSLIEANNIARAAAFPDEYKGEFLKGEGREKRSAYEDPNYDKWYKE